MCCRIGFIAVTRACQTYRCTPLYLLNGRIGGSINGRCLSLGGSSLLLLNEEVEYEKAAD